MRGVTLPQVIPQRYVLRLTSCWVCYQIAITADLCLSFKINGSIPFLVSSVTTPTVPLLYQFSVSPPSVPKHLMAFVWSYFHPLTVTFRSAFEHLIEILLVFRSYRCSPSVLFHLFVWAFSIIFAKSMTNVNVTSFQGFRIRFHFFSLKKKDSITILVAPLCVA